MLIHVKTSSTEEGMIVLHKSAVHHDSDMGTGADRVRSTSLFKQFFIQKKVTLWIALYE